MKNNIKIIDNIVKKYNLFNITDEIVEEIINENNIVLEDQIETMTLLSLKVEEFIAKKIKEENIDYLISAIDYFINSKTIFKKKKINVDYLDKLYEDAVEICTKDYDGNKFFRENILSCMNDLIKDENTKVNYYAKTQEEIKKVEEERETQKEILKSYIEEVKKSKQEKNNDKLNDEIEHIQDDNIEDKIIEIQVENEVTKEKIKEKLIEVPNVAIYQYKDYFASLTKEEKNKIVSAIDLKYRTFYNNYLCSKRLITKEKFDKILEVLELENEEQLKEANKKVIESPNVAIYQYKPYFHNLTKEEKDKIESAIDLKYKSFYTMFLSKKRLIKKVKLDKILEILGLENEGQLKEANEKAIESQNVAMYQYRDYFNSLTKEEKDKIESAIDMKYRVFYNNYLYSKKILSKAKFDKILEVLGLENEEQLKEANKKVIESPNVAIYQYRDYFNSLTKKEKDKIASAIDLKYKSFYTMFLSKKRLITKAKFDKILEILGLENEEQLKKANENLVLGAKKDKNNDKKEIEVVVDSNSRKNRKRNNDYIYDIKFLKKYFSAEILSKMTNLRKSTIICCYEMEEKYLNYKQFERILNALSVKNKEELIQKLESGEIDYNKINREYGFLGIEEVIEEKEEVQLEDNNTQNNIISIVDFNTLLLIVSKKFTKNELLIVDLLFKGYNNRHYSIDEISDFLKVDRDYVLYIYRRCLEEYRLFCINITDSDNKQIVDELKRTYKLKAV